MKKEVNMRKECPKREQGIYKETIKCDSIITDPNGSYTGVAYDNIYEKPVQDVDDL